jgi:2-polyprenyl-3-methyl-5-hydroxy-6-metoxy-1,4-benzoquinol methylase
MAFEGTPDQFPEHERSREDLLRRARELDWYHTLKLDETLTTPGIFALDDLVPFHLMPESLSGLDCLEVATGNGYWSFQMERRGARAVTATDIGDFFDTDFSVLYGQPSLCPGPSPAGAYGEAYRVAATLLNSNVDYRICSVYDLSPERVSTHDVVFCGSMLMHLFAPLLALHRMARICRNTLLLTTQVDLSLDGMSAATFQGHEISYVHFLPSPTCLVNMVRSCGYEAVLRGPTFYMPFRDGRPEVFTHMSVIGLKDAKNPAIMLPAPRLVPEAQRAAKIEILSGPAEVAPEQPFHLLLRVSNESAVAWRGDDKGLPLQLACASRFQPAGAAHDSSNPAHARTGLLDILPTGVSTLVTLRLQAPAVEGTLHLEPLVEQGGHRFDGPHATHSIAVVRGAAAHTAAAVGSGGDVPFLRPAWNAVRGLPGARAVRVAAKKVLGWKP